MLDSASYSAIADNTAGLITDNSVHTELRASESRTPNNSASQRVTSTDLTPEKEEENHIIANLTFIKDRVEDREASNFKT